MIPPEQGGGGQIARWNERFARGEGIHRFVPSLLLPEAIRGAEPGRALDLASGAGRQAIFLAERGWRVVAVDGAREGIELMLGEARRRAVDGRIEAHVADLEVDEPAFVIETDGYDLICDFYFLHRPLLDRIRSGVRPGGLFVAAIHVRAGADETGRFRLEPCELEETVTRWGWEILHAREGASRESGPEVATAEIIARRPADR